MVAVITKLAAASWLIVGLVLGVVRFALSWQRIVLTPFTTITILSWLSWIGQATLTVCAPGFHNKGSHICSFYCAGWLLLQYTSKCLSHKDQSWVPGGSFLSVRKTMLLLETPCFKSFYNSRKSQQYSLFIISI